MKLSLMHKDICVADFGVNSDFEFNKIAIRNINHVPYNFTGNDSEKECIARLKKFIGAKVKFNKYSTIRTHGPNIAKTLLAEHWTTHRNAYWIKQRGSSREWQDVNPHTDKCSSSLSGYGHTAKYIINDEDGGKSLLKYCIPDKEKYFEIIGTLAGKALDINTAENKIIHPDPKYDMPSVINRFENNVLASKLYVDEDTESHSWESMVNSCIKKDTVIKTIGDYIDFAGEHGLPADLIKRAYHDNTLVKTVMQDVDSTYNNIEFLVNPNDMTVVGNAPVFDFGCCRINGGSSEIYIPKTDQQSNTSVSNQKTMEELNKNGIDIKSTWNERRKWLERLPDDIASIPPLLNEIDSADYVKTFRKVITALDVVINK